jgi:hypothetical protein
MDERYREIYAAIYVGRVTGDPEREWLLPEWYLPPRGRDAAREAIRSAIGTAEEHFPGRVREDAKALLALNFHDLVVTPLHLGARVEPETVLPAVQADIDLLIGRAAARNALNDREISGHAIVDSLSQNWSELRVSEFRQFNLQSICALPAPS